MKLIENLDTLWKRWSTRVAASQAGLVLFWAGLPDEWKSAIPGYVLAGVVGLFAVAFISAQAVHQENLHKPEDK